MQLPELRFHGRLTSAVGRLRRFTSPKLRCFVSYRRNDVQEIAKEIGNLLLRGDFKGGAFVDTLDTEGGEDWRKKITRDLARSDVVFVVIGPRWSPERLQQADDAVRAELAAARFNRSVVVPLPIGAVKPLDPDDLPLELRYFSARQWPGAIPDDTRAPSFDALIARPASGAARRARRRKFSVRLATVAVLILTAAIVIAAGRSVGACDSSQIDVGVAVRVDDSLGLPVGIEPRPDEIADEIAATLDGSRDGSTSGRVVGPAGCGLLGDFGASDTPEAVAAKADVDVLVSGDLNAGDQESLIELALTFSSSAQPDAPEVAGTHVVGRVTLGKNLDGAVVAEAASDELAAVASVLGAFQRYSAGDYDAAAENFGRVEADLAGTADLSLLRVVGLLRSNSLLLQARSLSGDAATGFYDGALAGYTELAEDDGIAYGRAYLGIGQVWTNRCIDALGSATADPLAAETASRTEGALRELGAGLEAFTTAERVAEGDPATATEVGLKAMLGWGSLALCAAFLGERNLADDATRVLEDVAEAAADAGFPNLAGQANVGLATNDLARCDPLEPDIAIERAIVRLEAALEVTLPTQERDIKAALDLLRRTEAVATDSVDPTDGISSAIAGLLEQCTN